MSWRSAGLWAVAALAACTRPTISPEGRPCNATMPCGPGTSCDPRTFTCVKTATTDGPLRDVPVDGHLADRPPTPDVPLDHGGLDGDGRIDYWVQPDTKTDIFVVPDAGCPTGTTACGAECADLSTSLKHCGKCGAACQTDADKCVAGKCVCGATGAVCGPGLTCVAGACACVLGGRCAGCCSNPTTCVPVAGQATETCGLNGAPCAACMDGNYCTQDSCAAGVCQHANRPDGTTCSDGDDCTHSDACQTGVCKGTAFTCDDGLSCTSNNCLGAPPPNNCAFPLMSNRCLIGGVCYYNNQVNPASPCTQQCQPSQNSLGWTTVSGPCVITVAGEGTAAFADGAALTVATFNEPMNVAVDSTGKVYIADHSNHRIRVLDGAQVSTLAGTGVAGLINGPLATSQLNEPHDLVVDGSGEIYVADSDNNMIRRIASGSITTFAGKASSGYVDGPLLTAQLNSPAGIDVDSTGAFYIADRFNHRIRKIAGGQVTTLAGTGTAGFSDGPVATAQLNTPWGVAVDSAGAVYVADTGNHRIRKIAGGQVTTIAGSGTAPGYQDGPAAASLLNAPSGVAVDSTGIVVFCDTDNHRVRGVNGSVVVTVAGDGNDSFRDGPVATARFHAPAGLAVTSSGVYVADRDNHRIRLIKP